MAHVLSVNFPTNLTGLVCKGFSTVWRSTLLNSTYPFADFVFKVSAKTCNTLVRIIIEIPRIVSVSFEIQLILVLQFGRLIVCGHGLSRGFHGDGQGRDPCRLLVLKERLAGNLLLLGRRGLERQFSHNAFHRIGERNGVVINALHRGPVGNVDVSHFDDATVFIHFRIAVRHEHALNNITSIGNCYCLCSIPD